MGLMQHPAADSGASAGETNPLPTGMALSQLEAKMEAMQSTITHLHEKVASLQETIDVLTDQPPANELLEMDRTNDPVARISHLRKVMWTLKKCFPFQSRCIR